MRLQLKSSLSQKKTILILSILAILAGVISCVLADLFTPVLAGLLAVLYLYADESFKTAPRIVTLIVLFLNIGSILFLGISSSLFAVSAIIIAVILINGFNKNSAKADSCYLASVLCALVLFLSFVLFAMLETGDFTIAAVKDFYSELIALLKSTFINGAKEIYAEYLSAEQSLITVEMLEFAFDTFINTIISYFIIAGFVISGISAKVFSGLSSILAEDNTNIKNWRFMPTPVFAYFYLILMIASIFIPMESNVFTITVLNLSNIFMVIFAYVGFYFAIDFLAKRMRRGFAIAITVISILLLARFSLNLLSMLGVYKVILEGKRNFSTPPKAE